MKNSNSNVDFRNVITYDCPLSPKIEQRLPPKIEQLRTFARGIGRSCS